MADTPMTVQTRPFAIEPFTGVMAPDGIFDNAIYKQRIACHYTNTGAAALTNVTLYLESVGDPGIAPVGHTHWFATIAAGASVLVSWEANFQFASPGKPLISFIAEADGYAPFRTIERIFVSETRFDEVNDKWTVTVPEGHLEITNLKYILAGENGGWWPPPESPTRPHGPFRLAFPVSGHYTWYPNPPYPGKHGELPFADPFWKVLAIIAIWAGAIAVIKKLSQEIEGDSTVTAGGQGQFEETDGSTSCCSPAINISASGPLGLAVAGVVVVAVALTILAAWADDADPWWRGQIATTPAVGELTTAEHVDSDFQILEPIVAGKPGLYQVQWDYLRQTTGANYGFSVSESKTNVHIADPIVVQTPAVVHTGEDLWVTLSATKADQSLYHGPALYSFAVFQAPQGLCLAVPMGDDGLRFDSDPNDGTYTGGIDFSAARRAVLAAGQSVYGLWHVYVFAQDVNLAPAGLPPEIAAQIIGGVPIASPIQIVFSNAAPCPLAAQATINVVP